MQAVAVGQKVAAGKLPKVLVVDDSVTVRMQVVRLLFPHFECVEASDGVEALELARRVRPDAVITDLEMPRMDGMELLRKLRADPAFKSLPVLVCTSSTSLPLLNSTRALGCSGLVLKPMQREYVLGKLRTLLPPGVLSPVPAGAAL
jgi:CheY-like chemotaxis protein